ncbi:M15 family metallopeptidase [uncultured Pseudokineococcus sp.]|uniref:M15 family metallopeptidase n=1 Tax=uncultured Pseudokineococcus sp. TaxID=1642928 RepID=UPI0026093125|nr:M15 family metallopeptidase [uncultured Pseudokineococcus sp.]
MEGISGITARMAGIQAQIDALAVGGPGRAAAPVAASAPTSSAASSSAFSDALAQQLGQQAGPQQPGGTASSLAAALGAGTGAGGLAAALAGGTTATAEPAFTTTTTSLSSDGLAQLLAALPGARTGAGAPSSSPTVGAVGAAGAASSAPAVVGRLDARGVPLDLKAHGNGKVPEGQLVEIGGAGSGERLWGPAAAAYDRMAAAARADGVTWRVNDSYRSYEDQVSMAARKGLRSEGGLAAAPGTSSHGWGMAVDLDLDGRAQAWMRENAGRYGFAETVSGEPWHWGFRPTAAA